MKLTKLEVAQQQLDMASRLYVRQESMISIHTLAGAAEEILGHLLERTEYGNGESMFEQMRQAYADHLDRLATSGEVAGLVNASRNALKHARERHEDNFDYDPKDADVMLFRALANYQVLTGALSDSMELSLSCLRQRNPRMFPN